MQTASSPGRAVSVLPNLLSGLRLLLAVLFPMFHPGIGQAAVIVAAAASDFGDGVIARRFGVTSWVGGLLDAIADKVFSLVVLAVFTMDGRLLLWQALLLLSRDLAVAAVALYLVVTGRWAGFRQMPSRWSGKATTAVLFVLFLLLAALPDATFAIGLLLAAGFVLSAGAAVDYLVCLVRALRRSPGGDPSGATRHTG